MDAQEDPGERLSFKDEEMEPRNSRWINSSVVVLGDSLPAPDPVFLFPRSSRSNLGGFAPSIE